MLHVPTLDPQAYHAFNFQATACATCQVQQRVWHAPGDPARGKQEWGLLRGARDEVGVECNSLARASSWEFPKKQ